MRGSFVCLLICSLHLCGAYCDQSLNCEWGFVHSLVHVLFGSCIAHACCLLRTSLAMREALSMIQCFLCCTGTVFVLIRDGWGGGGEWVGP